MRSCSNAPGLSHDIGSRIQDLNIPKPLLEWGGRGGSTPKMYKYMYTYICFCFRFIFPYVEGTISSGSEMNQWRTKST